MKRQESAHDSRNRALITSRLASFGLVSTPRIPRFDASKPVSPSNPIVVRFPFTSRADLLSQFAAAQNERDHANDVLNVARQEERVAQNNVISFRGTPLSDAHKLAWKRYEEKEDARMAALSAYFKAEDRVSKLMEALDV